MSEYIYNVSYCRCEYLV